MMASNKSASLRSIAATYMRGGTSKGVFFALTDLPVEAQVPGPERDQLLLRIIGSPDAYGKQMDGMGGGSSSTSKVAIVSPSQRPDHDVDFLFGQVAIHHPHIDWSGNCGNLSAAVGPFAIHAGMLAAERIPEHGHVAVKVWQANIEKTLIIHVPIVAGQVQEEGDFIIDGISFPGAEIQVDFIEPAAGGAGMFPTGRLCQRLLVPELGEFDATLINAGIPTIFLNAAQLGLQGIEGQAEINQQPELLAKLETLRAHGALAMGLIDQLEQAQTRQHTPKIAFVAKPQSYQTSSGDWIDAERIDLVVRAMSMGQLHHAMMGTAAVAIAAAACVPGTLVNHLAGGGERQRITFGHPSGTLSVGAVVNAQAKGWVIERASMSRSARMIMQGWVRG